MNEDILRVDDPPENQNRGEEDILYFDDVKYNQDDEDILYFDDVEVDEKQPPVEQLTLEDWNLTEEDFIKDKSGKLARLYPEFEFEESGLDDQITVTNKRTGKSDYFDLGSTDLFKSDFDQFNEWIKDQRANMPELDKDQDYVYNRTGLIKNPAVTGFFGDEIQPSNYDIRVEDESRYIGSRDITDNELVSLIKSIESVGKEVGLNPGLALPKFQGLNAEGFTGFSEDEASNIKEYIYQQVIKDTNIPLTKDGFLKIYDTKLSTNIEDQFKNIASNNLQKEMRDNGMPEAASQLYVENKSRSIESNYTNSQKELKKFNEELKKTQEQIDLLEANKDRSSDDNTRILRLKQVKSDLNKKIDNLGGGVWSESGDWVNNLKLPEQTKQNLKEIEEQAADLGSALNMFSIEGDDLERLSTKDLTVKLLDQQMKESEYYTAKGNEDKITINPNKFTDNFAIIEAEGLLRSAGMNVQLKVENEDELSIINKDTGEKVGEVSIPFQNVFDFGVRSEEGGGYKGDLDYMFSQRGSARGLVYSEDLTRYRIWEQNKLETEAELRGLYKLVNLGEDPSKIIKPTDYAERLGLYDDGIPLNGTLVNIGGWAETAVRGAGEETLRGWFGFNDEEIQKTLGQSKRNKLDEIRSTISIINNSNAVREGKVAPIKLSKEQEENFETSLAEMSATGTGGFVPILVEFALFEAATAGTPLGASRLAKLPKAWQRLVAGAAKEELKMQASTADFDWGTGALFFGLGKAFEPIKFFKKHRVALNQLADKYVKAGPAGAMSIEASETIHAIVDDMMGNKDLGAAIEELYGDGSETFKRFISNVIMFKMTGLQHSKWRDFQSNGSARRERKILNDRFENFIDQGIDLLNENNITSEPPKKIINEKEVPPTSGEKSLFIEAQLIELSKQNTEAGNNAKQILNKLNKVSNTLKTVDQMLAIRNQNNALDPYLKDVETGDYVVNKETGERELNPEFGNNFNNFAMNPINDALKEAAPKNKNGESTYEAPEVIFGSGKNDKGFRENFDKDANGKDMGDTANYDPNSNKVYLDIDLYTPGKPLHELTHVVFEAYFKGNPQNRTKFTEALRDMFKDVDFGAFKDSDLKKSVEKAYKDKRYNDIKAEEYIAMLSEFLSNPDVYYNNRELAGTLTGELMSEIRLIKKKFGIGKNAKITTAADLVKVLGDLGMEMQRGYVSKTSAAQFSRLGEINVQDLIMETTTIKENQKKVKAASKQIDLSDLSKSSAEKDAKNKEIISSIKERAELSGDPAYYSKTPQDIINLWENNRGLSKSVLETWQRKTGFEFQKDDAGRLTEKGELDRESMLNALDMKLYRYAELYGNPNNLQQRTNETKEQFEKRKQQVENLDVPFFAYAAENMPKQIGNAIIESGLGVREGNKIIFKETIGGEAGEMAMSTITDPNITEANIRSTEKSMDFEEGRTDADGKALIEPISIIEPSKQESTTKSINERITEVPESYKATPDLSNVASEFGVRENRINNEDGTIRVGSFKFKDSEFKSAQDKFSEPGFLEKWYDIAIPEPQAGEGAREGVRGFDTGLQASLKNIVYQKSGKREKTGPGKQTQIKKPFSEVELPLQKLLGIEPGKNRVQNSKVNTALKNSIHQLGKAITNRTIRQRPELTKNQIENLASGKSSKIASKLMPAINELIRNDKLDRYKLAKKYKLNRVEEEILLEMPVEFENIQIAGQVIRRLAEDPKTFKDLIEIMDQNAGATANVEKVYTQFKSAYPEIAKKFKFKDLEYIAPARYARGLMEGPELKRTLNNLKTAAEIFPNLKMLKDRGATGYAEAIEMFLGYASLLNPLPNKYGTKTMAREAFNDTFKDVKGKGEYQQWMEFVYQPNWNTPGIKKEWKQVLKEANDKFEFNSKEYKDFLVNNGRDILTHPDLRQAADGYEITMASNRKAIENLLIGLKDRFSKVKNKESLEDLLRILQIQTNHQRGILGGLVPMEYMTMIEAGEPGVDFGVTLHNEHMKEKFNVSDQFIDIISNNVNNLKSKKVDLQIKKLVGEMSQALTTYEGKLYKDSKEMGGASKQVSANKMVNTYLLKGSAETSLALTGKGRGKTIADQLIEDYGLQVMKEAIKDKNFNELNEDGVLLKQKIDNNKEFEKVKNLNNKEGSEYSLPSKDLNFEILDNMSNRDKANQEARKTGRTPKKIRVFDFDDTLARSKNIVIARKGGKEIKLNAEDFAKRGLQLKEQGWEVDFSDFNKVTEGSRGPLFKVAERIRDARGNEDLFVLTARAPESRDAIYEFLKAEGLEFKRENIIGLGNSTGEAKANWLTEKAAEGYNDFYFADDAPQNVKAVRDALSVYDIKSKVQQAYASKDLSKDFNNIIEQTTGVEAYKEYSAAKAKVVGASKGKGKFWIPYSAEDFQGLIYKTLGKGKLGDKQMAWYKENLLNPYARAMDN